MSGAGKNRYGVINPEVFAHLLMGDGLAGDQLDNLAVDYLRDHGLNGNTVASHIQIDDAGQFGVNCVNRQGAWLKQEIKTGGGRLLKDASLPASIVCSLQWQKNPDRLGVGNVSDEISLCGHDKQSLIVEEPLRMNNDISHYLSG